MSQTIIKNTRWLKLGWLKTIHAKILQTFLTYLSTCLLLIFVLVTLVNLAFESTALSLTEQSARQIFHLLFGNWPGIFSQLLPLCVLLSTMFTYTSWSSSYELLACQTIGISILRFAVPIFFCLPFLGLAFYYNQSYALNYANNGFSVETNTTNKLQWFFFQKKLLHLGVDSPSLQPKENISLYELAEDGSVQKIQIYQQPQLKGNQWTAKSYSQRTFNPNSYSETPNFENLEATAKHTTTEISSNWLHEPFGKIFQEYQTRKTIGLSTREVSQAGLKKIADLASLLVMVLLALPLVQLSPRQGQLGRNLGLGILLGFVFWTSEQVFNFAGQLNQWPVWLTVFANNLCFSSAAVVVLNLQRLRYSLNSLVLHLLKKFGYQSF